jgi:hypothetical protein
MRRAWKWTRRSLIAAASVVAVALALWVAVVPGIVRRIATAQLAGMGLPRPRLEIRGMSLRHVEMANVAAGEPERLRIGAVGVRYTLGGLLRGRLATIEITGLEAEVQVRDGRVDFGPLAELGTGGEEGELPFGRIELRSSALILDLEGRTVRVPFRGTLRDIGAGKMDVSLVAETESSSLCLSGTLDTNTYDFDLAADGEVRELGALVAALSPQLLDLPGRLWGSVTFQAACARDKGELSLKAALRGDAAPLGADIRGHAISARWLSLDVEAELSPERELKALDCRVETRDTALDGVPLGGATLKLKKGDGPWAFEATAAGPGWKLSKLDGSATGLLEWLSGKRDAQLELAWTADAPEPWRIPSASAAEPWVSPKALGQMELAGRATVRLSREREGAATKWEVTAPELKLTLKPGDLGVAALGTTLEGLQAGLSVKAEAGPKGARLELLPGSRIAVRSASAIVGASGSLAPSATSEPLVATGAKGEEASLEATVGEKPGVATLSLREGRLDWEIDAPDVRLALRRGRVEDRAGLVADGVAAHAQAAVRATPTELKATLKPGSSLAVETLKAAIVGASGPLALSATSEPLVATIEKGDAPAFDVRVGDQAAEATLRLREGRLDWEVDAPDLRAGFRRGRAEFPGQALAEGVWGEAKLAVRASPSEATAAVAGGSRLAIGSLSAPPRGGLFALPPGDEPPLEATVGDKGLTASISLHEGKAQWGVEAPEIRLVARRGRAELPAGVAAEGIAARAQVAVQAKPAEAKVTLAGGSSLTVESLKLPQVEVRRAAPGPILAAELGEKGAVASASFGSQELAWSLEVPEGRISLGESTVSLPDGRARTEGLAGVLRFQASADPKSATVRLLPSCSFGFKSAEGRSGNELVRVGPARFTVREEGDKPLAAAGLAAFDLVSAEGTAAIESDGPVSVAMGDEATASMGTLRSVLGASWSEKGATLSGRVSVRGISGTLKRKFGEQLVAARIPEASLTASASYCVPPRKEGGPPLTAQFEFGTAQGAKPVEVSVADAQATAGRVVARGSVSLREGKAPAVEATLSLDGAAVEHKALELAARGISATVPVTWHCESAEKGAFAVKTLEAKGAKVSDIAGSLRVADLRAELAAACEPLKGAKLSVEGSFDAGRDVPQGLLRLSLPLFKLEDEEELSRVVRSAEGLAAKGSFALDGFLRVAGGRLRPSLALTVLDGSFKSVEWAADAEGVFATVRIDSFAPVLTPRKEFQIVLVKRARLGSLEVKEGFLAFRLEPVEAAGQPSTSLGPGPARWAAAIQRAECGWVGGRLFIEDVRCDPQARLHRFTVQARDLKLGEFLGVISGDRITGVGALSGQIPVTIGVWPEVNFGEGHLYPEARHTGWIQVKDKELAATLTGQAGASSAAGRIQREVRNRLLETFEDFEYDELKIDFFKWRDVEGRDRTGAKLFVKGRGRRGERQEIGGYTLINRDFDRALVTTIIRKRQIDALEEWVKKKTERKGDPP